MGEEKACAAVMAIGIAKAPEQKKVKLNNRDAEKFWPETYTADRVDKKSFAEFLGEFETCAGTRRDLCWSGLLLSATSRMC